MIKNSILYVFLLGYRLNKGSWGPDYNADSHKGVFAVTVLLSGIVFFLNFFVADVIGFRFTLPKPTILIAVGVIYFSCWYFLSYKKIGDKFEQGFDDRSRAEKIKIRLSTAAIATFVLAFAALSTYYYRAMH